MQRFILAVLAATIVLVLSGCAGLTHPIGLSLSVQNAFSTIQAGSAPVTLTASDGDPQKRGVTWSLNLARVPCAPGCGTLIPSTTDPYSAVYTPPSVAPLNAKATITVTSRADSSVTFVFNITITPGPTVVITTKFANQYAGGPAVQLTAKVENDSTNSGVAWGLTAGGAACPPAACGTLTSGPAPTLTATYVPPATVPTGSSASPTITAKLVAKTSESDSFSFAITSANVLFKGSYAFLVRGYDVNGSPASMAGSVTADGNGNITAGDLDINNGGGITAIPTPITGNYSIDLSFNGVIRGTFTLTSFAFAGSTHMSMKFTLTSDGKQGTILELDGVGFRTVGTIQLQDPAALSAANPAGTYAFGLDSDSPVGGRTVEAGRFVLTASGVTGGLVDESKAGDPTPRYSATPLAPGTFTSPNSSGRGTLILNVSATATGPASSTLYAYYVVNSDQLNLLEIDSGATFGTVQAGVARIQKPLTANSVNTTSVLQFTGMDAIPGTSNGIGPDVIIGVLKISGGNFFNLVFDTNDLGRVLIKHDDAGSVSFDPTTGRGMLASTGGFANSFVDSAVFYLYDGGQGFILDTDPSTPNGTPPALAVTNNAFSGTFTTQASAPFSSTTLSNNLVFSSGASAIPAIPNIESAISVNNMALTYVGLGDLTAPDPIDNAPNAPFSGSYSFDDSNLGHGTILLPQAVYGDFTANQLYPASFYLVGPNQFVSIGTRNTTFSGISFFNPQ